MTKREPSEHDRCFYVYSDLKRGRGFEEGIMYEHPCNVPRNDHSRPEHPFTGPPASDAALRELKAYLRRAAVRLRRGMDRHDVLNSEEHPDLHIGMSEGVDLALDYIEGRKGGCGIDGCDLHPQDDFSEPVHKAALNPAGGSDDD